jgi:hypothetical protein
MNTNNRPENLTGVLAGLWDSLMERSAGTGTVTIPAGETVADLQMLTEVGGAIVTNNPDGSQTVVLTQVNAPESAPSMPEANEVGAAAKKVDFAGEENLR